MLLWVSNTRSLGIELAFRHKLALTSKFMSPWRNWLARSAVNRKVGGSSPPGDADYSTTKLISRTQTVVNLFGT